MTRLKDFRTGGRTQLRRGREGYVYVVSDESGHCRVGYSGGKGDPYKTMIRFKERVQSNLSYSPFKTELAFSLYHHNAADLEDAFHWHLRDKKTNGSWYKITAHKVWEMLPTILLCVKNKNTKQKPLIDWVRGSDKHFLKQQSHLSIDVFYLRKPNHIAYPIYKILYPIMKSEMNA